MEEVSDFESACDAAWKRNYSDWPSKTFLLPPIFARKIKENLRLLKHPRLVPSKSSVGIAGLEMELHAQQEEDIKEQLFRTFESLLQDLGLRVFLISNLEIKEKLAMKLESVLDLEIVEISHIDFIIIASNMKFILIKIDLASPNTAIKELKSLSKLVGNLTTKRNFNSYPNEMRYG